MKYYYFFILLIISACSLNAEQEQALNTSTSAYLNAKNNGVVAAYVAYTHPNVVAYYKELGDSAFTQKFDLSEFEFEPYLQDGNILEIQSKDSEIHVKYTFLAVDLMLWEQNGEEVVIIATSNDDGKSWFYIEERDYYNSDIILPENRLIK